MFSFSDPTAQVTGVPFLDRHTTPRQFLDPSLTPLVLWAVCSLMLVAGVIVPTTFITSRELWAPPTARRNDCVLVFSPHTTTGRVPFPGPGRYCFLYFWSRFGFLTSLLWFRSWGRRRCTSLRRTATRRRPRCCCGRESAATRAPRWTGPRCTWRVRRGTRKLWTCWCGAGPTSRPKTWCVQFVCV